MALTPAGEYFARQCQSVLSQYHGAVKQARSIADGKKQDLRLGINGPYTQESIPGYLRQFRQLYPEAAIHLREGGREEILDALFQEELDVIVVPDYDLELDSRFDVLELNSERAKFMTVLTRLWPGGSMSPRRSWWARPFSGWRDSARTLRDIPSPTTSSDWDWERTRSSG